MEKELIKLAEQRKQKFRVHFIPIVSIKTVKYNFYDTFLKNQLLIEEQNIVFKNVYSAILDVKAAQFQGQKKGQKFLINFQQKIIQEKQESYSTTLAKELAKLTKIDMAIFLEDRKSTLVKNAFYRDHQKAKDLNLKYLPAAIIFDFNSNEDGIIIENYLPEILNFLSQKSINSIEQLFNKLTHKYDIVFENKSDFQRKFKIAK
jgi:predicted DsbA family dithiol-disulfide isomerase